MYWQTLSLSKDKHIYVVLSNIFVTKAIKIKGLEAKEDIEK